MGLPTRSEERAVFLAEWLVLLMSRPAGSEALLAELGELLAARAALLARSEGLLAGLELLAGFESVALFAELAAQAALLFL